MEEALGIEYRKWKMHGKYHYVNKSKYIMIRYADDFVVLCKSKEDAENIPNLLEDYLKERGLILSPEKTKITELKDGFDFFIARIFDGFQFVLSSLYARFLICGERADRHLVQFDATKMPDSPAIFLDGQVVQNIEPERALCHVSALHSLVQVDRILVSFVELDDTV